MVPGFGISLNLYTEDFAEGRRQPHLFNGYTEGMVLGPDQPHKGITIHGRTCRAVHADLSTCRQLWRFNLYVLKQDYPKKSKSSLKCMRLGRLRFL